MEITRQVGFKDIVLAELIKDENNIIEYGPVRPFERAISGKMTVKYGETVTNSDDEVEQVIRTFEKADVEIVVNQLTNENRAFIQGSKYSKGILIDSIDDIPRNLAMGFKSQKTDGTYRYVWLYKGSLTPPDDEYETKKAGGEGKTFTIKGTFISRSDGSWRAFIDGNVKDLDKEVFDKWFESVMLPTIEEAEKPAEQ